MESFDWWIRKNWHKRGKLKKKPCCRLAQNMTYAIGKNNRKDVIVLRCRECKCLHYTVGAESGSMSSKMMF